MKSLRLLSAALMLVGLSQLAHAEAVKKVGDEAPTFSAQDDTGADWKSADHVGKKILVVYFYPADMTGGCTKQACGFRDDLSDLAALDVEVVGVSGDSVENHKVFKKAHNLNFALLADPEGKVAEAFGVPFKKKEGTVNVEVDGKTIPLVRGGSASRWTFVIDKTGKIVHKDESVKAAQDSKEVAKVVKALKNKS
ncbi:peroxiredoxin [Planctomicrobium sp. SH664]|uniref:peroxiredoxin n=1 Tax=Planctomicrobium sp. SH664 TaxID=3448125 RepID=UPI003F5C3A2C